MPNILTSIAWLMPFRVEMLRSLGVDPEDLGRPDTQEMAEAMQAQNIIETDPVSRPETLELPETNRS